MISDTELKQVVYAFKCNKSTLQVKGKINSITLGKKGNSLLRNTHVEGSRIAPDIMPKHLFIFADTATISE